MSSAAYLAYATACQKFEYKYCSRCDVICQSKAQLQMHMQSSKNHPHCDICNRSFLNNNALKSHFVLSSKHHYCRDCDKSFKSPAGLRVHYEQSLAHGGGDSDDYDSDDEEEEDWDAGRTPGWEDEIVRRQEELERARQTEEPINVAEEAKESRLTPIQRKAALMNYIARRRRAAEVARMNPEAAPAPKKTYKHTCPVCLTAKKNNSSTRCGHVFCDACITHAVDLNGSCPSCRKPATRLQLRKVDLTVL